MTPDSDENLKDIADAIADDRRVDWDAERGAFPGSEGTLDSLRVLESVASAHRAAREPAASQDPPPVGEVIGPPLFVWGPHRVQAKLGEGSFGEVYRAWDPALQREVALKLHRPAGNEDQPGVRRWLEEARRLARVKHPNVIVVHGAGTHGGRAGIVTEILRGQTLEEWLGAHGPMSAREASLIGVDLCAALTAVHAAGLVHGDVKTSNVVRENAGPGGGGPSSGAGRIVLMDFGAAQEPRSRQSPLAATTPIIAAPEVMRGEPATPAADVYSLGVLLFRLVTGRYPVEAESFDELRAKLDGGKRLSLRDARPDLPPPFVQVVERALAGGPGERFGSASEMENALSALLGTVTPAPRSSSPGRRAALAFVLIAIAIGAGYIVTSRFAPATREQVSETLKETVAPSGGVPSLDVSATLFRTLDGTVEPLSQGSRVEPGDHLFLEIESRDTLSVYVFNEDRQGVLAVLFPVAGVDLTNPVPAGRHRLPGSLHGRPFDWQVTSAGGRETFLVLASRTPLAEIESEMADVPRASRDQAVSSGAPSSANLHRFRGVMGLSPAESPAGSDSAGRLAALARDLSGRRRSDLWTWLVHVDNSGQ